MWDGDSYDFLEGDSPKTVHPSLWRQSKLNALQGLFEVVPGIYQVRGLDLSNITFVEGDTGVIVIDPLISAECAAAAIALYRQHRGERGVTAVIYTHSHLDHFGGVKGVVTQDQVDAGDVAVIAPAGFVEHAVAENVFAGVAMARRAGYMYGAKLPRSIVGQVGAGLGQTTSTGEPTLIVPTIDIHATGETVTIDGVEIEFQMAPGTEAPAEMHFYFPRYRALCMAENATHTLHNLVTLRGALVRDPHAWATYLTEALELFPAKTDVVFASHHWPTWGHDDLVAFLENQRDLYAYLHDQTLRLINRGYTGIEIAEMFQMPPQLEAAWNTHGYYGSVSHNVKAIYQRYMGWFDGNPSRLWKHTPTGEAVRYIAGFGGVAAAIALARTAYDEGDFRWAATVLDHAIFVEPHNQDVAALLADTLEQLGYGSENGTWRNFFLSGSTELRSGNFGTPLVTAAPDLLSELSIDQFFSAMAIRVDAPRAWDLHLHMDWTFTDIDENYHVVLKNGVLTHRHRPVDADSHAHVSLQRATLPVLMASGLDAAVESGFHIGDGHAAVFGTLFGVLQDGDPAFHIVLP